MGTERGKYFSLTLPPLVLQLETTSEASLNNNKKKISSLKIITKIKPLCFTQASFGSPPSMVGPEHEVSGDALWPLALVLMQANFTRAVLPGRKEN